MTTTEHAEPAHVAQEQYDGPATLLADAAADDPAEVPAEVPVEVRLRGRFEPIDGRFHWYGRIAADVVVGEHWSAGDTVVLRTPHGSATGRLSDVDPWGRFRVSGLGRPPF